LPEVMFIYGNDSVAQNREAAMKAVEAIQKKP
jgi:hypothetical protein